jgi:hypothetical protein
LLIRFVISDGNVRNIIFVILLLLVNVDEDEKADGTFGLVKVLKKFISH